MTAIAYEGRDAPGGSRPSRVTVLGSANMDLVVTVDRAPSQGETVTGRTLSTVPGGKGANQALAAARAGGSVRFLGAVGDDAYGAQIRDILAKDGVDVSGLATADVPTGTAHIVVDQDGDNSIVVVPGANATVDRLTDDHRAGIEGADVLLLQLELPLPVVTEAAVFARSVGVRTVLTPAPVVALPPDLLGAVDLLVPNEHEAALLGATLGGTGGALPDLAGFSGERVITLGSAGASYMSQGGTVAHVPAFAVDAVDTTAAGDTFAGALAVAQASGMDVEPAMRWACAAAALSVQQLGASTSMPYRAEIEDFLGHTP
jgi:ribokinase